MTHRMYTCYSNIKSRQTYFDIDRAIKMLKKYHVNTLKIILKT